MALADIAKRKQEGTPWQTCQVCHALDTIPPSEAKALRQLLASNMRYSQLSDLLAADADTPLSLTAQALSRHARGRCAAQERSR